MFNFVLAGLLSAIFVCTIVIHKVYRHVTINELKRRARAGDKMAQSFYNVVGYGRSVDIILWFVIGLSGGLLFALLASNVPLWLATSILAALIWLSFVWIPNTQTTWFGRQLARYGAPVLAKAISVLYPVLAKIENVIFNHMPVVLHTGLYTRDDLIALLNQQKTQLDNQISKEELVIAKNALMFGEKLVRDCMTPWRVIKTVNCNEPVGPILMKELHSSGFSRYPVYEDDNENIVGVLYMRDMLNARKGGYVKDLMHRIVYYVHDQSPLDEVLQAFMKTHHHLFMVVNSFEEVVGLITMEDVLEQIIGKPILDEFDQYDNMRAVAARQAKQDHKQKNEAVKSSSVVTEVVE